MYFVEKVQSFGTLISLVLYCCNFANPGTKLPSIILSAASTISWHLVTGHSRSRYELSVQCNSIVLIWLKVPRQFASCTQEPFRILASSQPKFHHYFIFLRMVLESVLFMKKITTLSKELSNTTGTEIFLDLPAHDQGISHNSFLPWIPVLPKIV